ncbi:hypothetical protein F2Q70_00031116 [Brassica cretica]|uniref:Uncharacterized protein n=1 Tax=Brassica cretica TaxID=69181 RepID=A0A8S9FL49_BRACR|nr:hypothetical protein F2Q70_00031116 [Brassica cretica]
MGRKYIAIELSGTVREILETCVVAGCTVDGTDLKDLWQDIQEGEINIHDYQGELLCFFAKNDSVFECCWR